MAPKVQARRVDDGINGFIVIIIKFWSAFARSFKWDCHKKRKSKEKDDFSESLWVKSR
jgi:hypothetical protein